MLQHELAVKIVREVHKLIDEEIIVANTDGAIIASTNQTRVGAFHEGSYLTSKNQTKLVITENDVPRLQGVKAGINLPIFFQHEVIGVIGITGDSETVTPFGEIIRKMTELLIRENYYAEQFDWHSRAIESFVQDWLQSKEPNVALHDRARALSINLELNRTAAIVEFGNREHPVSRDIWSSLLKSFSKNKHDVITRSGNERMILLIDCSDSPQQDAIRHRLDQYLKTIQNHYGISAYAGVGSCSSPSTLSNSYAQAKRALKIAGLGQNIIFDEELTLEMIAGELRSETKSEYIQRTIGPLLHEKDLLVTLSQLFKQNHSLKNTAQALHIHINTLHYRLKKIEELTGLNPAAIHDLFCLYLAVFFLDERFLDDSPKK